MLQRFLDPSTLASISGLDLVAKTVVDGFVAGLHRSPDFGFSQEFAEYRAYSQGDDLRHVDLNVFARTEKTFLKRYRGETNTQLLVLLDTSASMAYGSGAVTKLDYARFVAASLCYMAHVQRDAAGLIVFDEEVPSYVAPSTRQGQLFRLLHAIEKAEVKTPKGAFVKRTARVNAGLCMGCGTCVSVCPSKSADLEGFTEQEIYSMVEALA